jgi:REP element-mobilizing transposase RayT
MGAMPDHIHILIGYNVNQLIPDLVEEIKTSSNSWIKEECPFEFFNLYKYYAALLLNIRPRRCISSNYL